MQASHLPYSSQNDNSQLCPEDTSLYFSNLSLLEKTQQVSLQNNSQEREAVELYNSRTGDPTIRFHRKTLHSSIDPRKEAQTLRSKLDIRSNDMLVFFGLGLWYTVQEILEHAPTNTAFLIERRPVLTYYAFHCFDLRSILTSPRTNLFLSDNLNLIEENFLSLSPHQLIFIRNPVLHRMDADYYDKIEQLFYYIDIYKLREALMSGLPI